jgi:hypothetical protein
MLSLRARGFALVSSALLVAACGGKVIVDGSTTGSGGSGGSGGGPTTKICGGKQGLVCADDEWCQWDVAGSCGNADGTGTCQKRPTSCTDPCGFAPICGCDGLPHCNECEAHQAGFDVSDGSQCVASGGVEYSAHGLYTDVPRYVIFKKDNDQNRCTRLIVSMTGSPSIYGIQTTMGWSVDEAEITPSASDCAVGPGGYPVMSAQAVGANGGMGDLKHDSTGLPCNVSIHATLTFPPGAPWVPSLDQLDADNLLVSEFCGG